MGRPVRTKEERAAINQKFWLNPGVTCVQANNDRPIMTVDRLDSRRVVQYVGICPSCSAGPKPVHPPTPDGIWCTDGKLFRFRNQVKGVHCRWIGKDGKLITRKFLVKELKPWKQPSQT